MASESNVSKRRLYIVEWREAHPHRGCEFYVHTNRREALRNMRDELSGGEHTLLYEIDLPEPVEELEMA